jgi:RNA polymerase sigma-70 factor (ECF subfamily)
MRQIRESGGRIFLSFRTDRPVERTEWRRDGDEENPVADSGAGELELIEAARSLSEEAWAEIYRRHVEQVYSYIYFRTGDRHTAEDLSADVFVKAIAGIKSYTYRGTPLLAWLYRIAHNVTADYRKAAARRVQHQSAEPAEDIEVREDALGMLDERNDMLGAIRELTEEQQQVIILRFYHGMTNAEAGRVMGKPEGAVKALQARGLRSLRRILGDDEQRASA